jgi:hypothetical protein
MVNYEAIERILIEEDVEGLLALGAPADEYGAEATMVAAALSARRGSSLTQDVVSDIIARVWIQMFGPFSEEDLHQRQGAFARIALRILDKQR